jgi:ferredoxin
VRVYACSTCHVRIAISHIPYPASRITQLPEDAAICCQEALVAGIRIG